MTRTRQGLLLLGLLLTAFVVAGIGGVSTAGAVRDWYPTLDKPPWTPPNAAFGPIWTVLYTAMAVAAWDVFRRDLADRPAWTAWGAQLLLNLAWSPVFFGLQMPGPGLVVITLLWAAIAWTIRVFWSRSRLAAGLLVPYLAWVTVAWTLNAWILAFN
jgi:tryptophan-rich sensory protein